MNKFMPTRGCQLGQFATESELGKEMEEKRDTCVDELLERPMLLLVLVQVVIAKMMKANEYQQFDASEYFELSNKHHKKLPSVDIVRTTYLRKLKAIKVYLVRLIGKGGGTPAKAIQKRIKRLYWKFNFLCNFISRACAARHDLDPNNKLQNLIRDYVSIRNDLYVNRYIKTVENTSKRTVWINAKESDMDDVVANGVLVGLEALDHFRSKNNDNPVHLIETSVRGRTISLLKKENYFNRSEYSLDVPINDDGTTRAETLPDNRRSPARIDADDLSLLHEKLLAAIKSDENVRYYLRSRGVPKEDVENATLENMSMILASFRNQGKADNKEIIEEIAAKEGHCTSQAVSERCKRGRLVLQKILADFRVYVQNSRSDESTPSQSADLFFGAM